MDQKGLLWQTKSFEELSNAELYELLSLRQEVFVVEQDCPYLDADNKDKRSWHLLGRDNKRLVAYARIVDSGISYTEVSIGRVLTHASIRRSGVGIELMQQAIAFINHELGTQPIRISAQLYLQAFYESLGFEYTGKSYLEDGIPHIEMLRP